MRLLIVIPTLDEAPNLDGLLPAVLRVADAVCIADGGSRDGTVDIASKLGARVVVGPPGRGRQLAAGARDGFPPPAPGDVLLFLHADTLLPADARDAIGAAIQGGALGGAFRIRFSGQRPLLRFGARLANLRAAWTRCPLGDHALFVRRDIYQELGGYHDWPLLEDVDFARRLARRGPTVLLKAEVLTSARRFDKLGILRTVLTNQLIFLLYLLGFPPARLARLYYGKQHGKGP